LGLRVEHPDLAAVELAEPEAILSVHTAAARPRSRGRGRKERELAGLRIDLSDALTTEVEEEEVVLRVGIDAVHRVPPGPHSVYGIYADSKNNLFFLDFGGESVGKIDAKTGKLTLFPTPTPRSRPRRGRMDAQDRLWFGEFYGGKIGMFDTKTEKFQEWAVPTPPTAPYDVVLDKNGA